MDQNSLQQPFTYAGFSPVALPDISGNDLFNLGDVSLNFADEDGFDFASILGDFPLESNSFVAREDQLNQAPFAHASPSQEFPIDPRLFDNQKGTSHHMDCGTAMIQEAAGNVDSGLVGHPYPSIYQTPVTIPNYYPQPQHAPNPGQPINYHHMTPWAPQSSWVSDPFPMPQAPHYPRQYLAQRPRIIQSMVQMVPQYAAHYPPNANTQTLQRFTGPVHSQRTSSLRQRRPMVQGSSVSSPSYLSESEFECCPGGNGEGFPNTQGWRFISGKKVSSSRKTSEAVRLKQLSKCYSTYIPEPSSWGQQGVNSKPLFTYTEGGCWTKGRKYNERQLNYYIKNCPRQLFIWVQQCPSQSNWRLNADDNLCRWNQCPVRSNKISPGWLRVAFDEYGKETSTGIKDPYKVAGTMHLWCFEQCCNLVEAYNAGKLFADLRSLPLEEMNRMSLARDTDRDIMDNAFRPWFKKHAASNNFTHRKPLEHEDTLSYALVQHHLKAQAMARQSTRVTRNAVRPEAHWKTLDVHMGNLGLYAGITERRLRGPGSDVGCELPPVDLGEQDSQSPSMESSQAVDGTSDIPDQCNLEELFGSDWQEKYAGFFMNDYSGDNRHVSTVLGANGEIGDSSQESCGAEHIIGTPSSGKRTRDDTEEEKDDDGHEEGSGGGPQESNTTAFLVRPVAQKWAKGSIVAVDAGVHLSAITRLIEEASPSPLPSVPYTLTTGPFAGLSLPFSCAAANAGHVTRALVDTYLITHPHLDHISGFVINTAGLPGTKPKKLAGLPSTIQAFKTHIFNNVIWPNLSDENNGAGLLTYLRLVDGGSPALGDGEGKGYVEICDGLLVKTWGVSHGHCIERHSHRGSASSASPRYGSHDAAMQGSRRDIHSLSTMQPVSRTQSLLSQATFGGVSPQGTEQERICVYDSSAYFIQEPTYRREVLIFGDVEPDSISLSPRNLCIWQEAAPKIAAGTLTAIFIECSYDDSRSIDRLYGHLKPIYVIEELRALAAEVEAVRKAPGGLSKKRKRANTADAPRQNLPKHEHAPDDPVSPKTIRSPTLPAELSFKAVATPETPHLATPTDELTLRDVELIAPATTGTRPLEGLKVVIIHVKEKLLDEPDVGQTILGQLQAYEDTEQLGCDFVISKSGQSFYF
ncbi:3',5'-cyclic-nucleotide phosphodiesterase [Paramyrothecium foliicola]|nr:3',5'-cyclic-nucleotide phosphodiesterase [Paramyrothecium foliicola]